MGFRPPRIAGGLKHPSSAQMDTSPGIHETRPSRYDDDPEP